LRLALLFILPYLFLQSTRPVLILILPRPTTCSPAGTASGKTDIKHKTFHQAEICPERSAVPVRRSMMLAAII
ncbi:MAG: hypothetical protein JXI43_13100, partial [Tissierellales bacterium]|nr:hypothetical protein [Tissierellales bacterium]